MDNSIKLSIDDILLQIRVNTGGAPSASNKPTWSGVTAMPTMVLCNTGSYIVRPSNLDQKPSQPYPKSPTEVDSIVFDTALWKSCVFSSATSNESQRANFHWPLPQGRLGYGELIGQSVSKSPGLKERLACHTDPQKNIIQLLKS